MARDIIITPKNAEPQIQFTGSGDVSSITLSVGSGVSPVSGIREAGSGISTLSFEGTQGQLFSITDNLSSGTLFSVADITGLPLLEVDASGAVKISEYGTSTTVGLIDPKYNFDVFGTGGFQGVVSDKFELYASGDALSDGQEKLMIYDNDGTFEIRSSGQGGGSINNFKIVSDRAVISSEENYITIDGQKTGDNTICRLRLNGVSRFKFYNEGFAPEASNRNLGGNSSTARWKGMYGKFLDLESLNATTSIISATAAAAQSASLAEFKASDDVVIAKVEPDGSIASSGTISSSGTIFTLDKIGIGTDTPAESLEIVGGDIRMTTDHSIEWGGGNNRIRGNSGGVGNGQLRFYAGSYNSMTILGDGSTNWLPPGESFYKARVNEDGDFTNNGDIAANDRCEMFGNGAYVSGVFANAFGNFATAKGANSPLAIGFGATAEGTAAIALGYNALRQSGGNYKIGIGSNAGYQAGAFERSTAVGGLFCAYKASGSYDSLYGSYAGYHCSGSYNTGLGFSALRDVVGSRNIEISNKGSASNSAIGNQSDRLDIGGAIRGRTDTNQVGINISNHSPDGTLSVVSSSSSTPVVTTKGAASQTANLTEWRASDNVVIAKVEPDGSIATSGNIGASGDITVDGNIGVGISNPTDRLTIAGNFGTTHIGYTTNAFRVTHNSNDTYLKLYKRADQSNAAVQIITGGDSYFNAGSVGIRTTSPDATLHTVAANSTDIGIISQGASAQTANLQEWRASDDVVIAQVEPDGSIATSGDVGVSGDIIFQDGSYLSTNTSSMANELRYYGSYFWLRSGSHGISFNVANSAAGGANISTGHSFSWNAGAITSPTAVADTHLIRVDANKVGIKNAYKNSAGDYGELIASGVSLSGVYLANHVPQDTTNMLYNNGGTLTFDGSAVGGGGGGVDAYTSGVAAYSSGVLTTGNPSGIAFFNIDGDLVAGSTTGSGLFYDESSNKLTFKGTNSQIEFRGDDDNLALKIGDSQSNNNEGSHIGFYWQGTSNSYFDTTSAKTRFRIANGDFWFKNNSNADIAKMEGSTTDPLWSLYPQGSSQIGQIIKGQAAHSANLSEWHASDDVVVASVGPDGSISASGDLTIKGDTINFSENSSNFLKVNTNLYFTHGGVNTYLLGNTMFAPLSGKEEHLGYDSDAVHRRWLKVWSHDFDADGTVSCSGGVTASSLTLNTTGTDDVITMTSTDASSTAAPVFSMMRDSASPADGDYLGQIKFKGNSDTGTERIYAKITGKILDASNTSEDGLIEIAVRSGGSNEIVSRIRNDGIRILNDNNLIIEDNGSIGIRTTSPSYGLDVSATGILRQSVILPDYVPATTTNALYNDAGTLKFNGSAVGGGGSSTLSGLSDTNVSSPANGHILIYDNGTSKWDNALMTSTGGTVSFTFGAGTINLEAGVGPSDERLKENVKSIEGSLDKILAMNPVEFEWRDGYEDIHKNSGKDIGFIAQDIEKIQPELVGEHKDFKTLDYEKFSPLIVGAIQELTEQIQEIKKHLNM